MNIKTICTLTLLFLLVGSIYADAPYGTLLAHKLNGEDQRKHRSADISFVFKDEELIDVINMIAAKKRVNMVLPIGGIKEKITLAIEQKLTLDEAWRLLHTILDIAGYSIVPKKDVYVVVKNSKDIAREAFPIYINTPIDTLPNSDQRIRYMYYLTNIKASKEFDNELTALLKEFLPNDAVFKADKDANGILIVAKSNDIKALMKIIIEIDQTGFQESLEVISLRYTAADTIAKLFNDNILKTAATTPAHRYRVDTKKDQQPTYFSRNVKVIAEGRTNALVVLGRTQAVNRVKDFIFKYIDVQLESGKSILHVYELLYLDAEKLVPVLNDIVQAARGGTEQAKAATTQAGAERFFDQVIITSDSPGEVGEEEEPGKYYGGNKLIIAARNDDWKRIKRLIEKLDRPQPQVVIEVLIADLILDDLRRLGNIIRNPKDIPFPGEVSAQAAMIDQIILDEVAVSPPTPELEALRGVNSDLNSEVVPVTIDGTTVNEAIPATLTPGTTAIAISDRDGRTWSILQILKSFDSVKILSHPHIIAVNNQQASIVIGESRLVLGQAAPATSGITRRKEKLEANTTVELTPRISAPADTVSLKVHIEIDQFTDTTDFQSGNRIDRAFETRATVKSGDILALGGLTQETTTDNVVRTPVLNKIPILGWLFKTKNKNIQERSIVIFITPTIIQPKLRGGIGKYTESYIEIARDYTYQGALFDTLRDPITRWFFPPLAEGANITEDFLAGGEEAQPYDLDEEELMEEEQILDESFERAGALKEFLVDQKNPLQINGSYQAPSRQIKQPQQPKQTQLRREEPYRPENKTSDQRPIAPTRTLTKPQQQPEHLRIVKNNLKNLLEQEANPLA